MKHMTWDDYYGGFYEWLSSTQKNYPYRLSDYGPADEVWEVAQELAFQDAAFAAKFLEKALAAGVRFAPEQVLEMVGTVEESVLSKIAEQTAVPFDREQLEEIYIMIDDASFQRISRRAKINVFDDEPAVYEQPEQMKGNAGIPLSPPPYGYMKNPDDPRFWVIDPEAAEVVRCIYRLALEGNGPLQIATALGTMGALNPSAYRTSKGFSKGGSKSTLEPTKWNHTTVKKILTLQEYCGDVVNFKTYSKSYKMKRRIENPEENRAIFLNVHEPIIDRMTWERCKACKPPGAGGLP